MAIGYVTTANTFQQWLIATQDLITQANLLTDGGNTQTFYANTNIFCSNNLTVTGNTIISGDLQLAGNLLVNTISSIITSGSANLASVNVTSGLWVGTNSRIYGNSNISGTLTVTGNSTLGNIAVSKITNSGDATITGNLTVSGVGGSIPNTAISGYITTTQIAPGTINYFLATDGSSTLWKAQSTLSIANTQITGLITASQIANIANTQIIGYAATSNASITGLITASQLANTAVSAGTYGSASSVGSFVVDAQGRITSASNVAITIGTTIYDDAATSGTYYPLLTTANSGTITNANTSSSKLSYNPSTGTLSSTVFTATSDVNAKTNIKPVINALETIQKINGVSFDWKDTGKPSYGVIAQEVESVLPEIVHTNELNMKSVDYNTFIAFLVESIKDLQNQINELKNK
jgi:trimeric autotransporter adhesin